MEVTNYVALKAPNPAIGYAIKVDGMENLDGLVAAFYDWDR